MKVFVHRRFSCNNAAYYVGFNSRLDGKDGNSVSDLMLSDSAVSLCITAPSKTPNHDEQSSATFSV